jgi:membrane peptidoglycan carboxypeptidase
MNEFKRKSKGSRRPKNTGRRSSSTHVTKSGKSIKVNRSLSERLQAKKDARSQMKARRMAGMPKSRIKRFFYRLHPKRMYRYWFSREGGVMALKITGIGIVAGFLLMIGLFSYFRKDLPNLRDISGSSLGGSIRYYDRTGETLLWEDFDAVKRIPVTSEDMSEHIENATIAIEDKDFFKHSGFDVRGITRAAFNNALGGDSRQGGSTITQQLVRLTQSGVGAEQTYQRKIKELILSIELERSYTKQEILTGYLNSAPYGNIQYGVETAARDYFQKPAKEISIDEAAFLAAIPKSPSFYSPYGPRYDKDALIGRQHYILDLMEEQGMITSEERDEAKQTDTIAKVNEVRPKFEGIIAPWFVMAAKERLEERFGDQTVQRGGWKVITTLDMDKQKIAEEEMQSGIQQVIRQGGNSAAFVAEDVKTGQVVALVGGADFSNEIYGQNNYARYRLPPGSSFKPYDYLAFIEHTENAGAGSVLYDTQGPLEGYPCTDKRRPRDGGNCLQNYDFRYPGPLTLRYALAGSRNVPAVKAMLTVGVDKTIETAESLGLTSGYKCYLDEEFTQEGPCYASSAIGDGAYLRLDEHVHAHATISRNGNKIPQSYILKIEDAAGRTVDEWQPSPGEQVVRAESAYIVADMMSDPNASYFSRKIHNYKGHRYSLKTGTTNDAKDGWLMGFSTQYSAGVWVGYHNRQVAMSGFMETMTQPIWEGFMNRVHDNLEPEERPRPSGVQTLPAFVVRNSTGGRSVHPSPSTDLFPSWYKQKSRSNNEKRVIDVVSNKLATECTPDRARRTVSDADANTFSSDEFVDGGNANLEQTDDIHQCNDNKPTIRILSAPKECDGSTCTLSVRIGQGTHPLSSDQFPGTLNVIINGETVRTARVTSAGTIALTFAPKGTGNTNVTVEVIDSVLYDNSATTKIRFGNNNQDIEIPEPDGEDEEESEED